MSHEAQTVSDRTKVSIGILVAILGIAVPLVLSVGGSLMYFAGESRAQRVELTALKEGQSALKDEIGKMSSAWSESVRSTGSEIKDLRVETNKETAALAEAIRALSVEVGRLQERMNKR